MRKFFAPVRRLQPLPLIFVLGLAAVAAGFGLVYLPAGLIVGGAEAAACSFLVARKSAAPGITRENLVDAVREARG